MLLAWLLLRRLDVKIDQATGSRPECGAEYRGGVDWVTHHVDLCMKAHDLRLRMDGLSWMEGDAWATLNDRLEEVEGELEDAAPAHSEKCRKHS